MNDGLPARAEWSLNRSWYTLLGELFRKICYKCGWGFNVQSGFALLFFLWLNIYVAQLDICIFAWVFEMTKKFMTSLQEPNADIFKGFSILKGKFCVAPSVMCTLMLTHFMEHNDVHSNPLTYMTHKSILPTNISCLRHFYASVIWSITIFQL